MGCTTSSAEAGAPEAEPAPPAEIQHAKDDRIDRVLSRLETQAGAIDTLTARARMTSRVDLLDEETVRFGNLEYAATTDDLPSRFAVRFDRLKMDGQIEPIDQAYIFDGTWLLDLDGDDRVATRRQMAREGEAADFDLGEGPFPIPLNLKKDRVLARFAVSLLDPAADDPKPQSADDAGVTHLRLDPKPQIDLDAVQIDLWFDHGTGLLLRAVTLQDDGDSTTVDLFNLDANAELPRANFDTQFPAGDWETQTVTLD
jgi:hypothetical protein